MGERNRYRLKTAGQASGSEELIVGRQAVRGALLHGKLHSVLLAADSRGSIIGEIISLARKRQIPLKVLNTGEFQEQVGHITGHQGIAALVPPYCYSGFDRLISSSLLKNANPLLIMLDHLEDPQNLGAIIRSADAVGAQGIILPADRASGVTAAARKVAAGAAEKISIARVTNLNQAAETLKKKGFWLYGAEADGDLPFYRADYRRPLVLVIGSEGKGLSRLLRQKCDQILSIPMPGGETGGSLNVAAATAVLVYTSLGQREGWFAK
jgi:23S rRNA (guanosine2251-2'-O)-methyltransferase